MISIQNLGAAQPFQKFQNPYTLFPVRSFGRREPIQILPNWPVKTFNPLPVSRESDIQASLREYQTLASRIYPVLQMEPGKTFPGTPIGPVKTFPGTPIGPGKPFPGTPIGPVKTFPGTPIGPGKPFHGRPIELSIMRY